MTITYFPCDNNVLYFERKYIEKVYVIVIRIMTKVFKYSMSLLKVMTFSNFRVNLVQFVFIEYLVNKWNVNLTNEKDGNINFSKSYLNKKLWHYKNI